MHWQYAVKYAMEAESDYVTRFKFQKTFIIQKWWFLSFKSADYLFDRF